MTRLGVFQQCYLVSQRSSPPIVTSWNIPHAPCSSWYQVTFVNIGFVTPLSHGRNSVLAYNLHLTGFILITLCNKNYGTNKVCESEILIGELLWSYWRRVWSAEDVRLCELWLVVLYRDWAQGDWCCDDTTQRHCYCSRAKAKGRPHQVLGEPDVSLWLLIWWKQHQRVNISVKGSSVLCIYCDAGQSAWHKLDDDDERGSHNVMFVNCSFELQSFTFTFVQLATRDVICCVLQVETEHRE